MGRIVGIDLGTTNTVVSVLEGERPRVLADERGHTVIPSIVGWKAQDAFVTGHAAANLLITRPDRAVYAVKRLMGRTFDAPDVQDAVARGALDARAGADGGIEVKVGEAWLTPQQVAAELLKTARAAAERTLGEPVEEAVITVPAYFNHAQRRATLEAARLAGLRCERLLNEPTAAALAYGHRRSVDARVVIFDLGGGTFDVSVLRMSDGIYEILATSGDTFLGGEDFDQRIVDHLCTAVVEKHGWDPRSDKGAMRRVKDAAEQAKRALSQTERADVSIPHLGPRVSVETTLTRAQVEELTRDLVARCVAVVDEALAMARVARHAVDDVILVGGMTRWPAVRDAVRDAFGRDPNRGVHPDEVVAIGAAIHAGSLEDGARPRAVLLDVTPFDLGIDTAGGGFAPVISRNSRVPCSETRTFVTSRDDQDRVDVTVRQGEGKSAAENEFLGAFTFEGLPRMPRMQARVQVNFRVDGNGVLHVTASDPNTGESRRISVRNYGDVARGEGHARVEGEGLAVPSAVVSGGASAPVVDIGAEVPSQAQPATPLAREGDGVRKKAGFFESLFGASRVAPPASVAPPAAPAEAAPEESAQHETPHHGGAPAEGVEEPVALDAGEVLALGDEVVDDVIPVDPADVSPLTGVDATSPVADPLVLAFGDVLALGDEVVDDGPDLSDLFEGSAETPVVAAPRVAVRSPSLELDIDIDIDIDHAPFAFEPAGTDDEDEDDAPTSPGAGDTGDASDLVVELPNIASFHVYLRGLLSHPVVTVSTSTPPPVDAPCTVALLAPGEPRLRVAGVVSEHVRGGARVRLTLDADVRAAMEDRLG